MEKSEMMKRYEAETGKRAQMKYHLANLLEPVLAQDEYIAWLEKIAKSTEFKECPSCGAEVIPNPYCHDLEQKIELLEMQLEETQAKAAAYDRLMTVDYVRWLEAKATAYDRVMSGGLTMKELANILKHPVAIENDDNQNTLYYFNSTPHIGQFSDGTQFWSYERKWRLPRQLVNFYGDWKDSLTLPDGWRER